MSRAINDWAAGRTKPPYDRTPRRSAMNNDLLDPEFSLGTHGTLCNLCGESLTKTIPRVNGCAYDRHDECDGIRRIIWPSGPTAIGICGCECHNM